MTLLDDLLLAARREADNPTLPGPFNNLPSPIKRVLADQMMAINPGFRAAAAVTPYVNTAREATAQTIGGEATLLAALAQRRFGDQNNSATQVANQILPYGASHPRQALAAARAGNDKGIGALAAITEAVADPANLIPMPVEKLLPALRASRQAKNVTGVMTGVEKAGAGNDLAALINEASQSLPLAPEKRDLAAYMRNLGLDKLAPVENLPSPLVPERTPNLLQLARDGNGIVETNKMSLPLDPAIGDLRAALKDAGMPQVAGINDLNAPSPLTPDKTPNLLRIAREMQRGAGARNLTGGIVKGARPGQVGLPSSIPATELDKFLQATGGVVGELPPPGASFWPRNGIPNEQVPTLFEAARKASEMGSTADALLPKNVDIPSVRMDGTVKNTLVAIAYGKQGRAITAATKKHGEDLLSRAAEIISLDPQKLAEAEKLIPGIGDQIDTLRTGISDSAPADLFAAIRKAVKDLDVDRANHLVDIAPQYGVSSSQAQLALNSAASRSKPSAAELAGLGSSVNFTPPGLNAAIGVGKAALNTPYLGTGIIGGGIGAAGGATTGAAGGGLLGALGTPEDRWGGFKSGAIQGAEGGAVLGAAIGAAGGAYGLSHLTGASIKDLGKNSFGLALEAQKEAALNSGKFTFTPKQLFSYWGNQTVSTARQWIQDGVWNKVVLQALQGKQATKELGTITEDIAKNLRLTGNARLSRPVQDVLALVGNPDKELELGVPLMTEIGKRDLSMTQSMGASATLSLLGGPTNLLGAGASLIKGTVMPGWSRFLHVSNGAINRAFREAALVDEIGNKLIPLGVEEFQKLGYDLSSIPVNELSAARVAQLHGAKAGAMWQQVLDNSLDMAQSRVRYLFGDYSKKIGGPSGIIERLVGTGIPFASWALRAYPVALDMAIQHPWVALGIYQYLQATSRNAGKDGRPNYTAGMVGFNTETPVIGAGARTLLGGQKGDAYIDPVAGISPVGGNMFQPQDEANPNPSLYQQVSEVLGRAGLPGLNPLVTAVSYILGLDYRAPTNLSRTQGLENSLGLVPGNVDIPDVGGAGLRKLRGLVSPLVAGTELGQKVGAQGDKNPTVFDPVARRYGELVVEQTGKTVDDPENRAYLYDLAAGTGELYDQAKREVLLSGAAKNAFSLTSPTSAVTQSASNKAGRQAKAGIPFDYTKLQALAAANIPSDIANAQQDNRAYKQSNPASAAYDVGSRDEALSMLMQDVKDRYTFNGVTHSPTNPAEQAAVLNRLLTEARYGEQFRNLDPVDVPPWKKK